MDRPHLARGFDAPGGAVRVLDRDAVAVDVGDHRTQLDFHAHLFQPRGRPLTELLAERRQHRGGRVEQDHPRAGGIDVPEGALQGVGGQFGDLPGHFDAGGTGADHGERQQLGPSLRVAGPLGLLEGAEDPSPHLQGVVDRLHARRELGELVVAEVGLAGAGRDDQSVVRGFVGVAEQIRNDEPPLQIDVRDVAEQHLDVALPAQDDPGGRGDVAFGHDAGGHLVQQRLEQVVGGAGDQLDVDVGVLELLCRVEPAESRSDDDDLMTTVGCSSGFCLRAHVRAAPDRGLWMRDSS
jgi:hypothetical protein